MSRGCMIIHPCGCRLLDGRLHSQCDRHKAEGGGYVPSEVDAWLDAKSKVASRDSAPNLSNATTHKAG